MAIIEYDTPPTGPAELGPGSVRRQYRSGLYSWTGWNNPAPALVNREDFRAMIGLAALDWWANLSPAQRILWHTSADRVHTQRPGNRGANTRRQPFSRWLTTVGPLTYHFLPNPTLAPTPLLATFSTFAISNYDHAAKTVDVTTTIDSPYTKPPPISLDIYQLRPVEGLPWLSWHNFAWIRRLTALNGGEHVYTMVIPLRYFQPPASRIMLWGRLRNGQDANDYNTAFWQT